MPVVEVNSKRYGVGYEWLSYQSQEEAKDKAKFLRRKGYSANVVKVRKGLYQVYYVERSDEGAKHPPLAAGFINLAGGYYYMRLNGKVFVLIKTSDGAVVHENVYDSLDDFENQRYEVLSALEEGQSRTEITPEQGKFRSGMVFSGASAPPKKVLILASVATILLASAYFLMKEPEVSVPEVQSSPASSVAGSPRSFPTDSEEAAPQDAGQTLKVGRIDLSCYEKFYSQALSEGRGSCEWSLTPDQSTEGVDFPSCEEALKSLRLIGAKTQWGQAKDYGGFAGYSFSIAGRVYAHELKKLERLYFTSLSLKVEGEVKSISASIAGVLICKRE